MNILRNILGWLFIIMGVVFGFYIGFFECFVGGIIQVIEAFKLSPISVIDVSMGLLKVIFASTIGIIIVILLGTIGITIAGKK